MAELRHLRPLEGLLAGQPCVIEAPGVAVTEAPIRAQLLVQLADADAAWPEFGMALPEEPNRRTVGDPYAVWWSPESRLVVVESAAPNLPPRVICHDVSDGLAVIDIAGQTASELLAMGCGLDLSVLGDDGSARTLLAQLPVLLTRNGSGYRIHVDRALLPHLWAWAEEAATALVSA